MRFLIVDDEILIASSICELIVLAFPGASAVSAGNVQDAFDLLTAESFDAAVLDANLNGQSAHPIAETLIQTGVPFFVITGNLEPWRLPPPLSSAAILPKPFREGQMIEFLTRLADRMQSDGNSGAGY